MPELLVYRLLRERACRAEKCNCDPPLKRTAGRHDFSKNCLHIATIQRTRIAVRHLTQDLRFSLRAKNRSIGFGLHVANFLGNSCTTIEQIENLRINRVDLFTEGFKFVVRIHVYAIISLLLPGERRNRTAAALRNATVIRVSSRIPSGNRPMLARLPSASRYRSMRASPPRTCGP